MSEGKYCIQVYYYFSGFDSNCFAIIPPISFFSKEIFISCGLIWNVSYYGNHIYFFECLILGNSKKVHLSCQEVI